MRASAKLEFNLKFFCFLFLFCYLPLSATINTIQLQSSRQQMTSYGSMGLICVIIFCFIFLIAVLRVILFPVACTEKQTKKQK